MVDLNDSLDEFVISPDQEVAAVVHEVSTTVPATPTPHEEPSPVLLTGNQPHRVYLITYSQCNMETYPTRQSFGGACVRAFGGGSEVEYFCAAMEEHSGGGQHYHVAILLKNSQRWLSAKKRIRAEAGAVVNFSSQGTMYEGAYFYATKNDKNYFHGHCRKPHPTRDVIGKNYVSQKANETYRVNAAAKRTIAEEERRKKKEDKKKVKRIDKLDIIDIIRGEKIKTDAELMLHGEKRRKDMGDRDLILYLVKLGEKGRAELFKESHKLENAEEDVRLANTSRLDIVREISSDNGNCICPHGGLWLALAMDIFHKNGLPWKDFANAVYQLLESGRQKHKNLIIVGESNCAKTFLLDPLSVVFKNTFHTPASSTFGWLGVDTSQVVFLNDYRWKPLDKKGDIKWDAFLRLLEGGDTQLPAPMNSRLDHILVDKPNDIPIFCTSGKPITFWKTDENEPQTEEHVRENKMMAERWRKPIVLTHEFTEDNKVKCDPCAWCFCKLVLGGGLK